MQRREFLTVTAAGSAAAIVGCQQQAASLPEREEARPAPRQVKMHVGCQRGPTSPSMLQFFKRHGVNNICGYPPNPGERGYWTVEDLQQTRDVCEEHGLSLDIVALPFLSSSHIDREKRGAIMLGESPQRDRDIEHIQTMIANCAKVGIPAIKYNMSLLGVLRTERTPGRGGTTYSTWKAAEAVADPPLTRAGKISDDVIWERISYFLERIIPVCEEHKVRAACHPHDPGTPPGGFQGLNRVLGTVDGLKKFVTIAESPYHGLNLCLGCVGEMCESPALETPKVIRYFGERKKIFNIHFRNIRGKRGDFQEVYPDEGDMDMFELARALRDVGYEYMVMPDHVPKHAEDPGGHQGFAFSYGYIKALIQVLKSEA